MAAIWYSGCLTGVGYEKRMFRISTIDTRSERRLVIEGTLTEPWVGELRKTWQHASQDAHGRKLIIDLDNATVISREGQDLILELMQGGARFTCGGVLTKYLLRKLADRCRGTRSLDRKEVGCCK